MYSLTEAPRRTYWHKWELILFRFPIWQISPLWNQASTVFYKQIPGSDFSLPGFFYCTAFT